jgi:hypothetical protein
MHRRAMSGRTLRNNFALTLLALGLAAVPAAASSQEKVCEGYDRKQQVSRLGGRNAFTKTPVASPADLKRQLDEHRAEVEALMAEKGLGHLTDQLYEAVVSGNGLSERDLERGETFEWMVYRKRGTATTTGPVCITTKKSYSAYVVELKETDESMAKAKCQLEVSGGACVGDPFKVDTSGSSPGVKVEAQGPGNSKTPDAPGTYAFTATAEAQGTKKVTTHTLVIPKICLNVAYGGSVTTEMAGPVDTCSERKTVNVPDCQVSLSLTADPPEIRRGHSVQVGVSGTYDEVAVTVKDHDGNEVPGLSAPGTVRFKKAGVYQVEATASRCNDLPDRCRQTKTEVTTVTVKPGWTFRFFALRMDPDEGPFQTSTTRPNGVNERTHLHLDGGVGGGAELEYGFNDRIGLAASVLYVPWGSKFFFDLDDEWEAAEDDISMLAFLIGPNFHLTPAKKVDFYLGPFVGVVDLDSTSYRVLGETQNRSFDADTVFGAQLGLDVPFGKGDWAAHFGVRYFNMTVQIDGNGPEVDADPISAEAGLAYKF